MSGQGRLFFGGWGGGVSSSALLRSSLFQASAFWLRRVIMR